MPICLVDIFSYDKIHVVLLNDLVKDEIANSWKREMSKWTYPVMALILLWKNKLFILNTFEVQYAIETEALSDSPKQYCILPTTGYK